MRLPRWWLSISGIKSVSNPYIFLLRPTQNASISFRQNSLFSQCSCHCSCQKAPDSLMKNLGWRWNAGLHNKRFSHRAFSSSSVPPIVDAASSPENNADAKTKRTIDQVVYHLQSDIRRKRRIHKAEIHNAVELIEKASTVEDFGKFLLSCCSDILPDLHPTYRVKLAERIWAVIRKGKEYSSGHFEAMLKVLALNEDKSLDPFSFLEEAKASGVKATGTMYFFALIIVCQRGDLEAAVKVLNRMKDNAIPVNERYFNALMLGNLRAGDVKGATDILEIMKSSQMEATLHTWSTLLQIYIETGNLKKLRETYLDMAGSQLTEDQYYELLKAAGRQNNSSVLDQVIKWSLGSKKFQALSVMNLSLQLMHLGHIENALKIIVKFEATLRLRKEELGTFFIKELHSASSLTDAESYLNVVQFLQGKDRNPYALNIAAESCLKQKKFEWAYQIFQGMLSTEVPVRPHYFLPAFIAETEENGTLGAIKVLKQMQSLDVQPDWEMLVNWIIPKLFHSEGNLLETLKIVKETCGLSYSSDGLLSAGLIVAIKEGKLQDAFHVVGKLKGRILYPETVMQTLLLWVCDTSEEKRDLTSIIAFTKFVTDNKPPEDRQDHVGSFIIKLLEADRSEEADLFVKDIINLRIPVSTTAAEIMKEKMNLKDELEVDVNLNFQHYYNGLGKNIIDVSQMDVTGLECHKQELESKGMNARGTSRKLFLKYCAGGDLDKVMEAKKSFEKEFGTISRGMKSALMGAYIRHEQLEPALQLFHELTDVTENVSDVVVDVYKIIDLATLMVKNGKAEEAIGLIHEKCPMRRIHRPESISRNIVNLLEAVSKSKSDHVYSLTQLFLKLRFINPTNPTLASSIRDLIRRNSLEAAVERMEEYTLQFNLNPCLQELTYVVLDKPDLLERLMQCSAQVKGEREAKRLLALAKADVGDIDGAAKGLTELGNDLRFASLLQQCEYLSSRKEIQKVLNLISAIRKTNQNYDCKSLYDIAIQACKRSGNNEGLQQLISSMEEQDLYISQELKEHLVKSS